MRFHITYRLPGYPSLQVERFSTLSEAEARYDELAANTDVSDLSQPFDTETEKAPNEEPSPSIHIEVTIEQPAQPAESDD